MARLACLGEALLAGAGVGGDQHGHWHVSAGGESHDNRAHQPGGSGPGDPSALDYAEAGSGRRSGAMNVRFFALVAGAFCIPLAVIPQGVLPFVEPSSRTTRVTQVVRNDFGQLKWTVAEAADYTDQQLRGRNIYLREGCWYCHSQFVRPVTGETRRWGPVSEAGENAFDVPHLFGPRRIG